MPPGKPSREQLEAVYEKVVKTYSHRPNVTGVDVGFRYDGNQRTDDLAVRIHVKEKIPKEALEADELFPQQIDDVPIDVIQAVYKPHQLAALEPEAINRRTRFDPIQPGISVSHQAGSSGTIGAIVYDRQTGRRGILSNWHVFVGSSDARPGDPIVQPGRKWGGRVPQDSIARLERFALNLRGDAALALVNASRDASEIQAQSNIHVTGARRVRVGELVEKSGQTTHVTRGIVDGTGQYTLDYSVGARTIGGFKVVPEKNGNPDGLELSGGGDSGSLWYAVEDHQGVGLHFAGETDPAPDQEHALACHLPDVLEHLDISLQPNGVIPPPPPEDDLQGLDVAVVGRATDPTPVLLEVVASLTRLLEQAMNPSEPTARSARRATGVARGRRGTRKRPKR